MRRKTKANTSSESPEKPQATRRSTRRGRASPVEQAIVNEYYKSEEETSSDSEEEYSPKKTRRTGGRRGARSKASSGSERDVKTPKSRARKRGAPKKIEQPVLVEEEEEEPQREPEAPQPEVEEPKVTEITLPDETNDDDDDDAEQENGGEKVSIEIVAADPEPHVTEDSESGFPQRTSSPEQCELYEDDDVHMKTLSPEQPSEADREETGAQSLQSNVQEEEKRPIEEEQRRLKTPSVEEQKESEDEDDEKRSSSPEDGELPHQMIDDGSKADDSVDEHSKESPDHNHSKSEHNSEDEEPVKVTKSPVKEAKAPEVTFVTKLTRNDGKANVDEQAKRKRRWLSRKPSTQNILAISTDSLKPLIADGKPVPLVDVKLDLTSDTEGGADEEDNESDEERPLSPKEKKEAPIVVEKISDSETVRASTEVAHPIGLNRKILLVTDDIGKTVKPPSPPRNISSCILFITNLVRPFTVLQLKGLLARTGRIVENGFWIDKIKSKCYVQYETEDQAVETRHALHGVRWPTSNPKCLHVDFGAEKDMQKAIESTAEDLAKHGDAGRGERIIVGWERDRIEGGTREQPTRPIREWDVGKRDEREKERERDHRGVHERSREREEVKRGNEGGFGRERRRSLSTSPARKFKKENEPPIRLLDDLFRKTKTTPSIYWLPLTAEQIAVKEEARRRNLQEHQKRMDEMRKERERERNRDRERHDRNRRDRSRSRDRRYR